jgi:SRSO17 transposase
VDVGQVGVVISYYQDGLWSLVDAELFLPESWFTKEKKKEWKRLHIPEDREFLSKLEIGKSKIDHAIEQGLPFEVVGADTWYGQDGSFRDHIGARDKLYMVSVPYDTEVYLEEPVIGVPETPAEHRGPRYRNERVLKGIPLTAAQVARKLPFEPVFVRDCERGTLAYDHACVEVWTLRQERREDAEGKAYTGLKAVKELLVIRKDTPKKTSYSLSNAPITTDLRTLAQWKANRYFVERTIQDTKTEAGWDDLSSSKYRAYMHTLAIDALALWFVVRVKLKMRPRQISVEEVQEMLGVRRLPELSFATIRDLLLTVFPLKTLTKETAVELVTTKLMGRVKSTRSRLKGTQMRM